MSERWELVWSWWRVCGSGCGGSYKCVNGCGVGCKCGSGCGGRVMLIFEDVMFLLWNHLFLCYPCRADFKTAPVFKIGRILVVGVNF